MVKTIGNKNRFHVANRSSNLRRINPLLRILSKQSLAAFLNASSKGESLYIPPLTKNRSHRPFSEKTLDSLLTTGCLNFPSIQIVKNGEHVSPHRFCIDVAYGDTVMNGVLQNGKIQELFDQGATIVVNGLDRHVKSIREIATQLSEELLCNVNVNAYLTPSHCKGFRAHSDAHDVLVFQLNGTKYWDIESHALHNQFPTAGKRNFEKRKTSIASIKMTPGSLLYLPRGIVHEAKAADTTSLHLTFGLNRTTWHDLITEALKHHITDEKYGKPVPRSILSGAPTKEDNSQCISLVSGLMTSASLKNLGASLFRSMLNKQPFNIPPTYFDGAECLGSLSTRTLIRHRENCRAGLFILRSGIIVATDGDECKFPKSFLAALDFIMSSSGPFRIFSIPKTSTANKRLITKRLLQMGILEKVL